MMADDMIQNVKERMFNAADADEVAVAEKRPAVAKLSMLKEVVGILQRSVLLCPFLFLSDLIGVCV